MQLRIALAFILLVPTAALAQQPPRQINIQAFKEQLGEEATELALCRSDMMGANQRIGGLMAEIKRLTDKYEPKKEPKP